MTGQAVTKGGTGRHVPQERKDEGMEGQDGWRDKKADRYGAFRAPADQTATVIKTPAHPAGRQA